MPNIFAQSMQKAELNAVAKPPPATGLKTAMESTNKKMLAQTHSPMRQTQ